MGTPSPDDGCPRLDHDPHPVAERSVEAQDATRFSHPRVGARDGVVVVIDGRRLFGQCMEESFRLADPNTRFVAYATVDDWQASDVGHLTDLVVLSSRIGTPPESADLIRNLEQIKAIDPALAVVVVCDHEAAHRIVQALDAGARGYVPTSTPLAVALHAFRLVRAGGGYVPASILSTVAAEGAAEQPEAPGPRAELFSPRQLRVARALRMGVPNKIIAYELNMCESTVKVHVRNIMKKLKARNRTEVAFLTNHLFAAQEDAPASIAGRPQVHANGHRHDDANGHRHAASSTGVDDRG